jgi:hypothetical protein
MLEQQGGRLRPGFHQESGRFRLLDQGSGFYSRGEAQIYLRGRAGSRLAASQEADQKACATNPQSRIFYEYRRKQGLLRFKGVQS